MRDATEIRWSLDPLAKVQWLLDFDILRARKVAEEFSQSDPYIFTDDDVLPMGRNFLLRGRNVMLSQPEYAVCSTLSLIEGENLAKGPPEALIYEVRGVGAPMWIRKGVLTELPEMDLNLECGKIDALVYSLGRKEGLFGNGLRHMHMGHGYSGRADMAWAV
jgi:hypothetical protein